MNTTEIPAESDITALAGHQFAGGQYTIEHWENFLLTECTGAELLPNGIVHPVPFSTFLSSAVVPALLKCSNWARRNLTYQS